MTDQELMKVYQNKVVVHKYVESLAHAVFNEMITKEEVEGLPKLVDMRLQDMKLFSKPYEKIPDIRQQ